MLGADVAGKGLSAVVTLEVLLLVGLWNVSFAMRTDKSLGTLKTEHAARRGRTIGFRLK